MKSLEHDKFQIPIFRYVEKEIIPNHYIIVQLTNVKIPNMSYEIIKLAVPDLSPSISSLVLTIVRSLVVGVLDVRRSYSVRVVDDNQRSDLKWQTVSVALSDDHMVGRAHGFTVKKFHRRHFFIKKLFNLYRSILI